MADLAGAWVGIHPDLADFAEELKGELDPIIDEASGDVRVGADTDEADAKVDATAALVDSLTDEPHEVEVGADTSGADAKLAATAALADSLQETGGANLFGGAAPDSLEQLGSMLTGLQSQMEQLSWDLSGVTYGLEHAGEEGEDAFGSAEASVGSFQRKVSDAAVTLENLGTTERAWLDDYKVSFQDAMAEAAQASAQAEITLAKTDQLFESLEQGSGAGGGGGGILSWFSDMEGESHLLLGPLLALAPALASVLEVSIGGTFVALPEIFSGMGVAALALVPVLGDLKNAIENELRPAFAAFQSEDVSAFFSTATQGIQDLLPGFEELAPFALAAARGIGSLFTELGNWSQSSAGLQAVNGLLTNTNTLWRAMGQAVVNVFEGFTNMGAQATPLIREFAQVALNVSSGFEKWSSDGQAAAFIAMLARDTPPVLALLGKFVSTITDVTKSLAELGPSIDPILTGLLGLADDLAKALPDLLPFAAVFTGTALFVGIGRVSSAISGLIRMFGAEGIAGAAEGASGAINGITGALSELALRAALPIVVTVEILEILNGGAAGSKKDTISGNTPQNLLAQLQEDIKDKVPYSLAGFNAALPKTSGYVKGEQFSLDDGKVSLLGQPQSASSLFSGGGKGGPLDLSGSPSAAQNSLTEQVDTLLSTLNGLAAPAKNAVVQQQTSLENAKRSMDQLVSQLVATHSAALEKLIPQLVSAYKAGQAQLAQLERAQSLTNQTNRINAASALASTNATGSATSTTDAAKLLADELVQQMGGSTAVTGAQINLDKVQQSTDAAITAAQDQVDAANAQVTAAENGTAVQQAVAARNLAAANAQLAAAQDSQQKQVAAANAQLAAAQAQQAAAVQLEDTAATIASDAGAAFSALTAALSSIASDASKAATDALTGSTSVASVISAAAVQSIQDQNQIAVDELAEQGLSGLSLQAAQAKVALDQMTASFNQQIGAIQVQNAQVSAQQTQLVDAAQQNLDSVTYSTQQAVNAAQQAYDATLNSNDAAAQAAAAAALAQAKASQQEQIAQAQAELDSANATAAAIQAQGAQALQSVQDQAAQAEAQQQAIYNLLEAKANQTSAVSVEINSVSDPFQAVDYMIQELKLAGVV